MKKRLLVLVTLLTMILIPWNVEAGLESLINTGDYKCETTVDSKTNKKITTCDVVFKNTGTTTFNGGTLELTITPKHSTTTANFAVNASYAKQTDSNGNTYTLNVEPIAAGQVAILGTVTYTANASLTDIDCGGDIIPKWTEATSDGDDSDDEEITDTGYAVPTVALAIGAVGVITVVATSKKKTKMYKI